MRLSVLLVLVCVAACALAKRRNVCKTNNGENLIQFPQFDNDKGKNLNIDTRFPCKYWAIREQPCGKYLINLSPGLKWYYGKYYLHTMWLGVKNSETNQTWEGRTTNKLCVKYLNSKGATDLFNKKDGNVNTSEIFEYKHSGFNASIQDKEKTFRVTFKPWDPSNRTKFPTADFEFECFADDMPLVNEYPLQFCAANDTKVVKNLAKAPPFNFEDRFWYLAIYYHLFTNKDIVQTNDKCTEATNLLNDTCQNVAQRVLVLRNCVPILHNKLHTKCVTRYQCDPMDVFVACVKWGCTGEGFETEGNEAKELCAETAEGIDFCREVAKSGNLTARVKAAKCYRNFLTIEGKNETKTD